MLQKTYLQSIISKYYLEGLIESVIWSINNNNLIINFIGPSKNLVGKINVSNFNFKDCELGVFDTTKLNKLLSIIDKDLFLDTNKGNRIHNKLIISDQQFTVQYSLANTYMIEKVPHIDEPEYDIEAIISNEDILAMIRAKTALQDVESLIIKPYQSIQGDDQLEFIFGEDNDHSNKISYLVQQVSKHEVVTDYKLNYNSQLIKLIMNANKEVSIAKLYISTKGLMKLEFENGDLKTTYFLIQDEGH